MESNRRLKNCLKCAFFIHIFKYYLYNQIDFVNKTLIRILLNIRIFMTQTRKGLPCSTDRSFNALSMTIVIITFRLHTDFNKNEYNIDKI